ncbi:LysE family translocator [Algicola sagamiensis]|uniref:LysE family translocator n=1 Tax=Algicola sagamiensis TaxID=163869 RepID=UPI00035F1023|nr:LysE family translocator [Algicola sagamiensis]
MYGIQDFWLFVFSGIMLNLIPGPDSLFVIGSTAKNGFRGGSTAAFGIGTGTLVHIFAAAFGLSAILATSATAFTIIKIVGCCYLIYMGLTMILAKNSPASHEQIVMNSSLKKVFYQGFLTNVLNPKVALFFLAFVPQFIDVHAENKPLAFLILGLVFNINAIIWSHILAFSTLKLKSKVGQSQKVKLWLNRLAGSLFGYFGIKLAMSSQS